MATYPVQTLTFTVTGNGATAGATSFSLQSFKDPLGANLTMANFGDIGYGNFEPNTTNEDPVSFTGITQNADGSATLTGVNSNAFSTPFVNTTGLRLSHAGSVTFIITNTAQFYSNFGNKLNDEPVSGHWTAPDPVAAQGVATKNYVDTHVNGGPVVYSATVVSGTAAVNLTAGQFVYLNASGTWALTNATASASSLAVEIGICQTTATTGNATTVLILGVDATQTGLVTGTTYFLSNTPGAIATSAGTNSRVIGIAKSATSIYFDPSYRSYIADGLRSNTSIANGVPQANSSGFINNGYIGNLMTGDTDQSQLTSNSTVTVGEANATGKHNSLGEKFIPTVPSIRGATLWKIADSGTFTGSVKVSLQADTAGSPSGSDLASYTITNAVWTRLTAASSFTVEFTSEYSSMVVGNSYWIVVTPSTSDNTNHPNLGANSAGGYASGQLKYNNGTDGWVSIATSILYFSSNEGVVSKIVETDSSSGIIPLVVSRAGFIGMSASATPSFSIPGGLMGVNGGFKVTISGGGSGGTFTLAYNGTTLISFTAPTGSGSAGLVSLYTFTATIYVLNQNSLSSQASVGFLYSTPAAVTAGAFGGAGFFVTPAAGATAATSSIDTSQPGVLTAVLTSSTLAYTVVEKIA